jgi:serine O-acetyltransferase
MKFFEYKFLVLSDLYRITADIQISVFIRYVLFHETYPYVFWMRTCSYTRSKSLIKFFIYPLAKIILYHLTFKLGILIPHSTSIGSGFYLGHFGGIIIHEKSKIGKNCNISHGVTIGQANRGRNRGYPTLGNNIYIGPGAKIVGAVKIGNNVAIGANCVVTKDIPDNSVVVGVPGKIISQKGSTAYIDRTDYDERIH